MSQPSDLLANVAIGLIAGAIGTAAMTAAQTAQMKATGREGSTTPAKAAERVLGFKPNGDAEEEVLSNKVHWAYGIALGGSFGLLASMLDDQEPATGTAFFTLVWGAGLALLPGLKIASPPTQWGAPALATDAAFHAVYASSTAAAYHGIKGLLRSAT